MIEEELSPVYATPEQEQNPTPEVQFPTELPKEVPNTMLDILNEPTNELVNEQREQQEKEQQAKAEERRMAMGSIEAELVVDKDRTEQEKARIVGNFIKESSGSVPRNMGQFEAGMDKVWSGLGGEGIAPNINAVFDKLQQKSISNKKTNDKAQDMFKRGTRSVFTRDAQDPTFELMTTPMSKEERKQFSEAYKIGVKRQNERYGARNIAHYHTVREDIDSGIDFDIISEDVADFTVDMSGAEKSNYLSGLRESINDYPTEKRDQLIDKIGKNARISLERAGDFVTDSTKTAIKSVRAAAAGFFNESQKETNPIAQRAQLLYETSMHYTDMERSVKDILMSEVEPLDYVTDENSIGRTFEDAAYAVPQVAVSVATIAAPMILGGVLGAGGLALNLARGTSAAAGFNMSASEIMESKRQGYLQGGADFDTASNKAAGLSTYAQSLPHYFIERMKVGQLTRKSGVMNSIMGKLDNSVRNRGLRYLAKAGVQGVVQTAEEMGQNIYTEFVKDVTNVLDSEMADVVWSNGEDGVFDEFWAESAVTFLTMAPFAVWSAGGLMSAENRAAQWAKLPELHLKAYGYDEQSIANLKNANSPRERTLAHSDAEATRDGKSDSAKEAVDEINKALLKQQEAIQQAQYNGDFPVVKVSYEEGKPTYRVYEPKSENLMLETDNPDEATSSAMGWVDDKADAEDARFIFLNTLMQASARMTEKDPDSVKMLDTGEVMTRIKALAENPDQARRLAEQAEMAEIASGGDGSLARIQFNQPIYGSNQVKIDEAGQAKIIDTIYKGGNIMTLIHEEGHANFKRGVESGAIDMQDTINLLRKLDKVMGDRMTEGTTFGRDTQQAKQLRFLKGDAEPTFAQVDEAVAELWEALIMGEGRFGSMRELIKENMKAYAQMGVGNTITNFVKALRHYFNLALTRAMAIKKAVRDGVITEDEIDAFRAKMQGTTEQEEINAEARQRFDETLRPAFDESYSMGSAQDATYMDAVNSGDMDTAQAMVDARAKEAGYDSPKVYHGTKEQFDTFDIRKSGKVHSFGEHAFFFTTDEQSASNFAKVAGGSRIVSAYLKIENPLTQSAQDKYGATDKYDSSLSADVFGIQADGHDGVVIKYPKGSLQVVFNHNQIKSADPVTYDADGNVIPLSQRFDEGRDEISFSVGDVPAEIENANDPIVKHIFLKEDGKFYEKMQDGYIVIDQSLDEFEGMAIMLHQPDGAMAGTLEIDGDKIVDGKGGVYYPVMFGDQGYFWASTRDAAKGMAANLNKISKRNNGKILMALTSAPIEKMFSSTTMSTGALDLFAKLTKNPDKYGITEEMLNKSVVNGSRIIVKKINNETKKVTYKQFPRQLNESDGLAKNMEEMKKNLLPDESIFGQRGQFVRLMAKEIAQNMALPTVEQRKKLKGKAKKDFEVKLQQALNIATLLAGDTNLYNKTNIPKGNLAESSILQGMGDLLAEPLVKTFQQAKGKSRNGRIYAVLEMEGEVEAVEATDHESYPFALRSTSGQTPKVHVLRESRKWHDVVYAAPNKKNKNDKKETQPLYDGNTNAINPADHSSIFSPTAGVSMRELVVRKPDEGVEAIPLSYSMGDTARHGIMQSIEERVDKPQLKAEMLGDAVRNVQELIDKKNRLVEELKTINEDGKTVAQLNLEEKLRVIESEIGAMDQAYDHDVKRLESEHEIRKGDIGEDIVAQFAHRVDFAKGKKKAELKREAKARESERQKGEGERFKLEKKNLKSRLKAEKANLETEAEKVRTKLATKDKESQRKMIRDMLVTYEALLMTLPTDIRGKMGKSVRIVDINTDEKILDFFEKKLDRLERVMDSYIGRKFNKSKDKLFKRATIKKQSGKKDKGKLKHQIHDVFQSAKDASKMTEEKVMAEIASLDSILESQSQEQTLTDSEIDVIKKQKVMIQLFGNWKELSNAEKEAALINGWTDFEYNFTLSKLEQAEDRARRLAEIDEAIKSTGVSPDDANYLADLKDEEGNKLKSRLRSAAYGLVDFEQFLTKVFGEDSKVLDFVNREQKADAMKIDRMRAHEEAISQMFEEIAGSSTLGVKAAKLQHQMQNTRYVTKTQKRSLTQLHMIQARLMWRQPDGRKHMEGRFDEDGKRLTSWSYDQKFMDEIDSLMTNEARAVEQFLMDQYQEEWADLNAVHQRVQNATLPRNYPYAPLTVAPAITKDGEVSDPDPITGQSIKAMKGTDGFLLRRNKGAVAEPVFRDALSTFLVHKTQVEHWMAYAEFNRDLATIAGSREARKSIKAKTGAEGLKTLDGWTSVFANNGLMQSYADTELAKKMNRAVSRTSQAILFGRLSVLAIQSTQLGAAAAQMPTMSYTKRLGMLMSGQLEFKKAFNSDFIQRRMSEAPPAVRLAMQNMASGKPNVARAAAEKMGTLIAGTDAFFTAGTYAIIFDYLTTNKGMSEKDAHAQAERLTEQVAQPTRMGRKSLLEMQFSRQPTAKLAWAFASEPRQKMMLMAFRMSENGVFSKEAARAAITTVVFGGVFASLIRTIGADVRDDDDEEVFDAKYWNPMRLALNSVTAPLQGVPVFGDLAEYLLLSSFKALGADTGYLFSGGDIFSNAGDMGLSIVKLGVTMSDLAQQDPDAEVEDALKHLDRFLSGMGVINNNAAAAASFSHLMKDLFMIGKNIAK